MVRTGIDIFAAHRPNILAELEKRQLDLVMFGDVTYFFQKLGLIYYDAILPWSLHYFPSHLSPGNEREKKGKK
jgi:hypothetical protein